MDWIQGQPAAKWGSIAIAVLSALSSVAYVYWFLEDQRRLDAEWYADDIRWNDESLVTLSEIAEEMGAQTLRLDNLDELINRHWSQREDRFEELETEHKLLMQMIAMEAAEDAYRQGLKDGRVP